ncbi:hypothetical protein ACUW9N_001173 [Staphylococcus auricularis]|uniref:GIY-YIG domain-containing protein n=1 Tax=Staphylococcus auricularis TaxID=29379 RepID=A0AAP8PNX5_9STAP|nr:hypothetical protein [Staphylococcus auricularis]MBM0867189.1 hypothetical protein [Staphylococcus auricularis]MCG7341290.1 hypothetical protein [Staphylococcus auricularis]MDC6327379.1 hypothetical protein [Staphylococcus auricularis]MDN4534048.1 hypothetical protein [Staphylococcus auricularis]PNZ67374.1 hypothetical protein CD158_06265 [Staphylococcus auricularis]
MKADKKIEELLEDYKKPLKKVFKYNEKDAISFEKEDREKVLGKNGVFVIFDEEDEPVYVGQAGGYSTGHRPTQKDLYEKLGQFNLKSDASTNKFKRAFAEDKGLDPEEAKEIRAIDYELNVQFIKVKGNPTFINILELLALEYAKSKDIDLYNFK